MTHEEYWKRLMNEFTSKASELERFFKALEALNREWNACEECHCEDGDHESWCRTAPCKDCGGTQWDHTSEDCPLRQQQLEDRDSVEGDRAYDLSIDN